MEVNGLEVPPQVVQVADGSAIGAARRAAVATAERVGFDETLTGRVALVATELATNLVRHAGGGLVVVQLGGVDRGLELLAVDRGPGIANVAEALRNGYSTSGTSGTGLGAVGRIADGWELFSGPGLGTVVLARFSAAADGLDRAPLAGGVSLPHPAERVCGDGWAAHRLPDLLTVLVVDGLGHGPLAAEAATEAVRVFRRRPGAPAVEVVGEAHAALRPTRGAAIGVAEIRPRDGVLTYVGVGNISGSILRAGASRSLVSHAGIVGHQCHKIQEFTYSWEPGSLLVLHSDGLQSRWQLTRYPGLAERHPTVVAAALCRDYARGNDDVTVVAVREAA